MCSTMSKPQRRSRRCRAMAWPEALQVRGPGVRSEADFAENVMVKVHGQNFVISAGEGKMQSLFQTPRALLLTGSGLAIGLMLFPSMYLCAAAPSQGVSFILRSHSSSSNEYNVGRRGMTGMLAGLRGMSTAKTGVSICYITVPGAKVRNALSLPCGPFPEGQLAHYVSPLSGDCW